MYNEVGIRAVYPRVRFRVDIIICYIRTLKRIKVETCYAHEIECQIFSERDVTVQQTYDPLTSYFIRS